MKFYLINHFQLSLRSGNFYLIWLFDFKWLPLKFDWQYCYKCWTLWSRRCFSTAPFSFFFFLSQFFKPLLGSSRPRGRYWAAIRLSHRLEPSGRAVREEVDGLDIEGQHGRRFILLRHTQKAAEQAIPHLYKQERDRPTPVRRRLCRTQALLGRVIPRGLVPDCRCRGWKCEGL